MDSNTHAVGHSWLEIPTGRIEALKWVGLVLMLAEHGMRYVVGDLPPWLYQCGRLAFPLFVFSLALGLHRQVPARLRPVLLRMFGWALVAQAAMWFVEDPPGRLNVLFTFAMGLTAAGCVQRVRSQMLLSLALLAIAVVANWCEFGPVGVAFVGGAVLLAQADDPPVAAWVAVGGLLTALALPNDSHFALAAVPIAVLILLAGPELPRVRGAFYRLYVLQFPVFALARLVT